MIKKYKKISIIYGSSGRAYAEKLNSKIEKLQTEQRYPIESKIVMENILTHDILSSVTSLFRESQICIAILTADDLCLVNGQEKRRVRQNVVMELGMALFHLGRENCILLSTFDVKDSAIELPSDMNGLEIKQMCEENADLVFDQVIEKILSITAELNSGNAIDRYDNLLAREDYFIDYENLFSDHRSYNPEEGKSYGDFVLDSFVEECASLTHYDERAMFFFERIGLIYAFGLGNHMVDWYIKMQPLLENLTAKDIAESKDRKTLGVIRDVVCLLINNVLRTREDRGEYVHREICDDFEAISLPENVNPLISTVFYDYKGLAYKALFGNTKNTEYLKTAIFYFEKIMNEYADLIGFNLKLWSGFVLYNLGGAYDKLNDIEPNKAYVEKANYYFKEAIKERKKWLTPKTFNENVKYTLSYEYFIAKLDHLNFMAKNDVQPLEQICKEYEKVDGEIGAYRDKDGKLKGISDVQEMLERYRKNIATQ